MSYKINITDNAASDLYQIYDYIEKVLFAPKAAENLYNDIMDMIKSLGEMPERYREYDRERFSDKNLRFVNVKNYDILYTVNNQAKQVDVVMIAYAPSDIPNKIVIH
ncbi:MAG: type II toxin-antitoxin system RelE/ParE family toxin [Ruminococcaceae bacterium]|nr:type II toxin-antitoxin system RelE/ParE family toxin [Oscillospiraceae bacterium]